MREITSYCVGGLGNRLRPLASCYSFSKMLDIKLSMVWLGRIRCLGPYEELFKTEIENIPMDKILSESSVSIYAIDDGIRKEKLRGNTQLIALIDKFGYKNANKTGDILNDKAERIIVLHNNFLSGANKSDENEFLQNIIKPTDEIHSKIQDEKNKLGVGEDVIGVHARGTDFPTPVTFYTDKIDKLISKGHKKFFVCSDSAEFEKQIKNKYGDDIITRDKVFVEKHQKNKGWGGNVHTSTESLQDALVDLYLLAETNFKVYNNNSTFAIIVLRLKENL